MKKIAFLGVGKVGFALADSLQKKGHQILIANDRPQSESVLKARERNDSLREMPVQAAIDESDVIFLALPYQSVADVLHRYDFRRKLIVDCTNPVGPGMTHGLESRISGSEAIAAKLNGNPVVKAFTIYGFENFTDSHYPGYNEVKPAMLLAGDDLESKEVVGGLCEDLGWEAVDTGGLSQALHLEHMTLLWINMARIQGKGPDFVWARLQR